MRGSHSLRSIAHPSDRAASHPIATVRRVSLKSVPKVVPADLGQAAINRFWSASMGRMSGAVRACNDLPDHRRKVDMLRIWRTDAIATDRAAAKQPLSCANLVARAGSNRRPSAFQADAHTD